MTIPPISFKKAGGFAAWFIVSLAMLFYFYDFFLRVSTGVMVQDLMKAFHLKAFQLGNLSAFYYYIYTAMQIPVGILFDRYKARWLMIFAVFVCALGAFLFGLSHHIQLAQFSRFLMGLGSAFGFVGVLKVATRRLPDNRIALVSGLTLALGMIGAICGDVVLSRLILAMGWRNSMHVVGVIGVIIVVLFYIFLRRPPPSLTSHPLINANRCCKF